ncbi:MULTISPECIES: O-antigen polymerase [unclassified Exiguobacterium]|uniref:O-antigen polymerase n=1 Tax=unclassified Exiguobacterium TaxID=2644629 RepID=UPI001BE85CD3|nr:MULTISPECIES: O-antigen polymerase [unclassified Exiguobacterium]
MNVLVSISILILNLLFISMSSKNYDRLNTPFNLICSLWTIMVSISLIIFYNFNFSYLGILYIEFMIIFLFVGELLFFATVKNNSYQEKRTYFNENLAFKLMLIVIILSMIFPIKNIYEQNISLSSLFNFNNLLEINNLMATERYAGQSNNGSLLNSILLISVYLAPLIGGYNLNFTIKKSQIIFCILTFLPSISIMLTQNAKAGVISSTFLFISAYLVGNLVKKKSGFSWKKTLKNFFGIIISLCIIISLLFTAMLLRVGKFDIFTIKLLSNKFLTYAFGHIPAFDEWISHYKFTDISSIGVKTFYGIFDFLGIVERQPGLYKEVVFTGPIFSTNVYTWMRPLIEDFGIFFSLLIFIGIGILIAKYTFKIQNNNEDKLSSVLLTAILFFLTYFVTSAWSYMSFIASFVFFCVYLILIRNKIKIYKET